jgi:amino acid transporter
VGMKSGHRQKPIGYWSVLSIGIGGMVGGGIFAVLGLAVQLARGGTPVAFLLAGAIAMVTASSYARLSARFRSQGGTVGFINHAFGTGVFAGGINVLLWLSYVIMLSLYAYAFGSYGSSFFQGPGQGLVKHLMISGAVVLFTGLNVLGAEAVARSEDFIVAIKLSILFLFIAVGLFTVKTDSLAPAEWSGPFQLIAGGMIIFLAYEGFELIANTAGNVQNPERTLPRAYFSAVGFVILLYVLVSGVAVGNLPVAKIVAAKDYALAEAAKPLLGSLGFVMIGVAAMLSTASAINATLYGSARISYVIAKDGELPERLDRKIWSRPVEGLLITSALTLVTANLFDLSSIATMGSSGFLVIFATVNAANARLAAETRSRRCLSTAGAVLCLGALAILVGQRAIEAPRELWILVGLLAAAFAIEVVYRKATGRVIKSLDDGG